MGSAGLQFKKNGCGFYVGAERQINPLEARPVLVWRSDLRPSPGSASQHNEVAHSLKRFLDLAVICKCLIRTSTVCFHTES